MSETMQDQPYDGDPAEGGPEPAEPTDDSVADGTQVPNPEYDDAPDNDGEGDAGPLPDSED